MPSELSEGLGNRRRCSTSLPTALWILGAFLFAAGPAEADDSFLVIVNPSVNATEVHRSELSQIFLKRRNRWSDGQHAVPVDQSLVSPVREAFTGRVHGKGVRAVKAFWEQQIFSGAEVPPPVRSTDDAVIAYVRSQAGAVGYVSSAAALSGVRVMKVVD